MVPVSALYQALYTVTVLTGSERCLDIRQLAYHSSISDSSPNHHRNQHVPRRSGRIPHGLGRE
jgi:hypothetical protein